MSTVRVGIIMGSDSDWSVAAPARDILDELGVASEARVLSAHRTPHQLLEYGAAAAERGLGVLIGAAGGAAHLPGMLASVTTLPVIGLPVPLTRLDGMDSLLSIVQMPAGIPVATVAIGAGQNAGLLAARILAVGDPALGRALLEHQRGLAERSRAKDDAMQNDLTSPE
jgi:5-(carboxyamino)imidazole ribonucleotide mutase